MDISFCKNFISIEEVVPYSEKVFTLCIIENC